MTDLETYQPAAGIGQYQAGIVMTPESAKALDEQVRLCTKAVLREGVDYGHIPGTNGEEKSLWRPGAQKLLQWFRLECVCDRVEIERDDDGRKHGITYRAEVGRGLKTATPVILATCEGTADYDEDKFYQTAEERQRKAEDAERKFAAIDKRPPRPTRWQGLPEYRADWNALMKRAQKRAIVGAVVDATAAGGIFTDREEDDETLTPAEDDGPTWFEQALETAHTFTDIEEGRELYIEANQARRENRCNRRQQDWIQNTIKKRVAKLEAAASVDVEDLAQAAADSSGPAPSGQPAGQEPAAGPEAPEDQPGSASKAQLTKLHATLTGLGFSNEDREQKLTVAEVIAGRTLTGPREGRSSGNLSMTEARKLIDTLDGFADRDALIAYMAEREQAGWQSAQGGEP